MTRVTAQMSISLDGFYAGPMQDTPDVTHVRYRVGGRAPLTGDERTRPAAAAG
jgi:hypothetical protein